MLRKVWNVVRIAFIVTVVVVGGYGYVTMVCGWKTPAHWGKHPVPGGY